MQMTYEQAMQHVVKRFPFDGYVAEGKTRNSAYSTIASTVLRHLRPGSKILDFGCGPCDKTAVLQFLGYQCSGYDDLQDDWHKLPGNLQKILAFAQEAGIDLRLAQGDMPFQKHSFDMVMLHDVIEHLHDSPRGLLNSLLELVKPEGLLFVTVPNAVNIRKRIDVLFGKTNLPCFDDYYWYPGSWRGHVREYVRDDLRKLAEYLKLEVLELSGCDHMLQKLPNRLQPAYLMITNTFTGWKDSWLLVAKKTKGWIPVDELPEEKLAAILGKSTPYKYSA